jgi:putative addiction module CopG family antidote
MDGIALPPDLEQFAAEAVASGRFRDIDELVRTGVDLVRRRESARAEFVATLDASLAEGERDGFFSVEEVERDMDAAIAEVVAQTRP